MEKTHKIINQLSKSQSEHISNHLSAKIHFNRRLKAVFQRFCDCMSRVEDDRLAICLKETLELFPQVECTYVIDKNGHQMTDTVFNDTLPEIHVKNLFTPYRQGDEATLKAYYYVLKTTNQPMYISDEYLSLASGHRCITVSGWVAIGKRDIILCLDILTIDV